MAGSECSIWPYHEILISLTVSRCIVRSTMKHHNSSKKLVIKSPYPFVTNWKHEYKHVMSHATGSTMSYNMMVIHLKSYLEVVEGVQSNLKLASKGDLDQMVGALVDSKLLVVWTGAGEAKSVVFWHKHVWYTIPTVTIHYYEEAESRLSYMIT